MSPKLLPGVPAYPQAGDELDDDPRLLVPGQAIARLELSELQRTHLADVRTGLELTESELSSLPPGMQWYGTLRNPLYLAYVKAQAVRKQHARWYSFGIRRNFRMDLSNVSKAIAGGLITAVVALLAHYGLDLAPEYVNPVNVIATGLVAYAIGHLAVYFAPANKPKI